MKLTLQGMMQRIGTLEQTDEYIELMHMPLRISTILQKELNLHVNGGDLTTEQMRYLKRAFGPLDFKAPYVNAGQKSAEGSLDISTRHTMLRDEGFDTFQIKIRIEHALACEKVAVDPTGITDAQLEKLRHQIDDGYVKLTSCKPVPAVTDTCDAPTCCEIVHQETLCYTHFAEAQAELAERTAEAQAVVDTQQPQPEHVPAPSTSENGGLISTEGQDRDDLIF